MIRPATGTSRWAAEGDGALTLAERCRFVADTLRVQTGEVNRRLRRYAAPVGMDLRTPPDSRLARDVFELAAETYSRPVLGHCLRCWYWADLFAQHDRINYDPELLFAACLLHDVALPADDIPAGCFAVYGGRLAQEHLLRRGAPEDFAERAAEAITLHMNPSVPPRLGAEAHLLHAAAHLDVAGTRANQILTECVREVVRRHPRAGFADTFGRYMRREVAARPYSRAALAWRLGMSIPLRHNPLDRIPPRPDEPSGALVTLPDLLTGSEATGSDTKPPVLLLHGMMGGAWQFSWLQQALTAAGYRSLAINYRGHHDSRPVGRLGRLGVADYLADALDACAYLGGRPIVIGQSMGGLIAQLLAARDAVHAAVLVCSLPPAGIRWDGARNPRLAVRHLPALLLGRPLNPRRRELYDLILNQIPSEQRPAFFARQVPESSRAGAQIGFGRIPVDPAAITCPILSVSASADRLVHPHVGRELAHRYKGDHLHLDGPGHYAIVGEPGWQQAADQIIAWLDHHAPRTPNRQDGSVTQP